MVKWLLAPIILYHALVHTHISFIFWRHYRTEKHPQPWLTPHCLRDLQSACVCVCAPLRVPERVCACPAKPRDSQTLSSSAHTNTHTNTHTHSMHTQCPLLLPCSYLLWTSQPRLGSIPAHGKPSPAGAAILPTPYGLDFIHSICELVF